MKKIPLIILISFFILPAFGQNKLPDTLYNTQYIDVVRIKDTVISTGKYTCKREVIDKIIFSNGKKVYSYSNSTRISKNGEVIGIINSSEILRSCNEIKTAQFEIYDKDGNLIKTFPIIANNDFVCLPWTYYLFNNGNILVYNSDEKRNIVRLNFYNQDSIIPLAEQFFYDKNIALKYIDTRFFKVFEEQGLLFVKMGVLQGEQYSTFFNFYNLNGILLDSYQVFDFYMFTESDVVLEDNNNIIINYKTKFNNRELKYNTELNRFEKNEK